jgi:hypothetical protein
VVVDAAQSAHAANEAERYGAENHHPADTDQPPRTANNPHNRICP